MNERAKEILNFWFLESSPKQRFSNNIDFDKKIRNKFFKDYNKAISNEYDNWQEDAKECLALIIILDQFSRNLNRKSPKAFEMDKKAKLISKKAIKNKYIEQLSENEILFMILPLIHSEEIDDHYEFHNIFDIYFKGNKKFEEAKKMNDLHTKIIKKFNRYPYRNKVLNRISSEEEIEYLKNNHHGFFNI